MESVIHDYQAFTSSTHVKLKAINLDLNEEIMVFLDWDDVRKKLCELNNGLKKFSQIKFVI